MSWLSTLTRLLLLCLLCCPGPTRAQTLESALMPGPVIGGHAEYETRCDQCHQRFDRSAQAGLCLACHKEIAADVRQRMGYHGRLDERDCRTCHTEHKGRTARIVRLDEKKFDHRLTDFILKGAHLKPACTACHSGKAKHRAAPQECNACHRKDDRHKGGLGPRCENCHNESTWKETRFDHQKTRFALTLKHADAKCAGCHAQERYVNTPRECVACHREDDAHKGFYGQRCENCHNAGNWKQPTFRHDHDTHYPLLDRHRTVKCTACHLVSPLREKTPTRCNACHRNDDPHKGTLGERCEKCHSERGWKGNSKFSHELDTRFPLRDAHKSARCESCHKDKGMQEKLPTRCFACHKDNDQKQGHKGLFGEKCETCHNEKTFKPGTFQHDKETTFALTGKHRDIKCTACHRTPLYRSTTSTACEVCHKNDDIHFGSYGARCDHCHGTADWRKIAERRYIPPEALRFLQDFKW